MSRMQFARRGCQVVIAAGDITQFAGDAIVNAANERMLGGGGLDGAIHRAAGPQLRLACQRVEAVSPGVRCPTGEARITAAFELPCQHVIHTVGPVFDSQATSAPLLSRCFQSCLDIALEHTLQTIAFPAISCGVFGYPMESAAQLALEVCSARCEPFREIHFILLGAEACSIWQRAARSLAP